MFLEEQLEVAAGVKQQLEADIAGIPEYRLLDERFMVIRQAMGLPKSRGIEAAQFLAQFVESMKVLGKVGEALQRHSIHGATVAPASE
jgi:polar amino acid transport system substrate-binding protein